MIRTLWFLYNCSDHVLDSWDWHAKIHVSICNRPSWSRGVTTFKTWGWSSIVHDSGNRGISSLSCIQRRCSYLCRGLSCWRLGLWLEECFHSSSASGWMTWAKVISGRCSGFFLGPAMGLLVCPVVAYLGRSWWDETHVEILMRIKIWPLNMPHPPSPSRSLWERRRGAD